MWPDRQWLIDSLVKAVPGILASQNPTTGRFGTKPWTCQDQNVIFPLAAAWAIRSSANPFYHDPQVLRAICKGGDALVDAQDDQGKWLYRKRGTSTWGRIYMPWTYSRWIRAYSLIKDAMPANSRAKWEKGLIKGFSHIRNYLNGAVHDIPTHHAMALYIAGKCFGIREWERAARRYMAKVVAAQNKNGFWTEHYGPVVGYNQIYVDALGIYYAVSKDATVLPALERSARFHANFLWPDGSSVAAIDERQIYHPKRNIGNVGFSYTALGRGYLLRQTAPLRAGNIPVNADYAASMLLYGGTGPAEPPPVSGDRGRFILGANKALVQREKPWQFCFSAYCCPVPRSRWIQDRQNFLDVFHDGLGLIIGGGNTKMQPYWSTFTVGDIAALHPRQPYWTPELHPHLPLRWVPTRARLIPNPENPVLELYYQADVGRVKVSRAAKGALRLTYSATLVSGRHMEAHIPILKRTGRIQFASGLHMYLENKPVELTSRQTGKDFVWDGLQMTIPAGASLKWPCRQHNPYTKDGHAPLSTAKLVMILPFSKQHTSYSVLVSQAPKPHFEGIVFDAPSLQRASPTGTRMKPLRGLDSVFLGATRDGESMTFTLPVGEAGTYELFGDFVLFPAYGIVQLSLDGKEIGKPFDAYAPELDSSGAVSFGTSRLEAGPHTVTVKVVGKNPRARHRFISVKKFILEPQKPGDAKELAR